MAIYDRIGVGYAQVRRPDPRIADLLHSALGDAAPVVDVGAGSGSYEPADRLVVAVEPSAAMIGQRSTGSGPVARAIAERLPFAGAAFAGAMVVLSVHHWDDPEAGLAEVRRVTGGPIAILTFDPAVHDSQWLVTDYLPEMARLHRGVPSPGAIASMLGDGSTVSTVPIAHDCLDGFCHAWWRRPHAYLDARVRAGISGIARLPPSVVTPAMMRLRSDLDDGSWAARHQCLLSRDQIDAGYRLVVSGGR
jgi:SAM-dependent methyltransferase